MPDFAYKEATADQYDHAEDWKEIIDSASFPSGVNLSNEPQEATVVGYIPAGKVRSAARFFLQYAYCDKVSPYRLYRENPHRHPQYPWLYASDFSAVPYIPKANPDNPQKQPYKPSPWDADSYYATSEYAVATVRYRAFRCDFHEDEEVATTAQEWQRNTAFDVDPQIEAMTVTGGKSQLAFAETAAGGPTVLTPFSAPLPQLVPKVGVSALWSNVPWEYLSASTKIFRPTKILACVGTTNSATFLDGDFYKRGTMLMLPPKFSFKPFPVAAKNGDPLRAVDVVLNWQYLNPEKGVTGSAYYGHLLYPWNGDGTDGGDGRWYFCTRDGTTGGRTLLPETDHGTVFKNVNEP